MNKLEKEDITKSTFFTSPVVLEEKDAIKIKEVVLKALEAIQKITKPSACEKLYCLNLDWFEV